MRVYEDYDENLTPSLVKTDIDNLIIEIKHMSSITHDYGVYRAYAYYHYSKAKIALDRERKELAASVRNCPADYGVGPPDLKTAIEEVVASNPKVQALEDDLIEKKLVLDKLDGALNALEVKNYNVGRAVKLWLSNYYADDPTMLKNIESMDYEEIYEQIALTMEKHKNKEAENEV